MTGNTFGNGKVVRTTQSFKPLPFVEILILKMAKTGPLRSYASVRFPMGVLPPRG